MGKRRGLTRFLGSNSPQNQENKRGDLQESLRQEVTGKQDSELLNPATDGNRLPQPQSRYPHQSRFFSTAPKLS